MNIVFLDFDGVIVTSRTKYREHDPVATQFIAEQLNECDGKIVVSSTWRLREDSCKEMLERCDLIKYLHTDWRTIRHDSAFRGDEIDEWLSRHGEVTNYIILDDDSDFHEHQLDKHVHTHYNDGILTTHMLRFSDLIAKMCCQNK